MQDMQDMFLSKFKKLKQKNKVLFHNAVKESGYGQKKTNSDNEEDINDDGRDTKTTPEILIINE